jgi:putative transcriptional regulator
MTTSIFSQDAVTVKKLRKKLRLTQEQFAQKLGVSFATINRWENGKHKLSPLAQIRLRMIAGNR